MIRKLISLGLVYCSAIGFVSAQKERPKPAAKPKPIIFAVLNDGKTLEPVALVNGKELTAPTGGDDEQSQLTAFARDYYRAKAKYTMIFGGASAGSVAVVKRQTGECAGNSAEAITVAPKAKIKGFVMALATNAAVKPGPKSYRRMPTPAERAEIDALVRSEFEKKGDSAETVRQMKYHNLTALDLNDDSVPEFVGTYWTAPKADQRRTMFVIAEKVNGRYSLTYSEYAEYDKEKVMSGEVKDLDDGVYHNLLLDVFDFDGDGQKEIFTTAQAFEGRNFSVYGHKDGKWTEILESYNYRCGY